MPVHIAALAFLFTTLAGGAIAQSGFVVERVATGLTRPLFVTAPPGDRERVFVVEQHTGNIRILRLSDLTLLSPAFLTVPGVSQGNEQGLLGLAFDPDYATNGFFYVYYMDPNTRVVRYEVSSGDPNDADEASATPVLSVSDLQTNHNGGWIAFGPNDGLLYIAIGDGGGSNDSGTGHTEGTGNAQDLTANLLGKILRIDVHGDDFPADAGRNYAIPADNPFVASADAGPGDGEIWAFGLRNPYRASFDRLTGDLYIGDVGQGICEELNVQPAASAGGENYGWRLREGTIATPTGGVGGAKPPGAIDPIFDYPHLSTQTCRFPGAGSPFRGFAITGGTVYRGPVPELAGRYFFADFGTGRLWSLLWDGSDPAGFDGSNFSDLVDHGDDPRYAPDVGAIGSVSSFGEDDAGNLYVVDLGGEIFRVPEPAANQLALAAIACLAALSRRGGRVRPRRGCPDRGCRARRRRAAAGCGSSLPRAVSG